MSKKRNNYSNNLLDMDDEDMLDTKLLLALVALAGFTVTGFVVFIMYVCRGTSVLIDFMLGLV